MGISTVSQIIAAFVGGALGIAALLRNFRSRLCVAFALLAAVCFCHDVLVVVRTFDYAKDYLNEGIHCLTTLLVGASAVLLLGEVLPKYRRKILNLGLGFIALQSILTLAFIIQDADASTEIVGRMLHLGLGVPAILWLLFLFRGSRESGHSLDSSRLEYPFWGGCLTLSFFATDLVSAFYPSVPALGTLARSLYFLFLYQIFVQREAFTAEEVFAKVALFGSLAVVLSVIYTVLVSWVGDRSGLFLFNTFIASFVILVLFDPIRRLTSRWTRGVLLRRNQMLEDALHRLSFELTGVVEPKEIARRLILSLTKWTGDISHSSLYLLEREGLSYWPAVTVPAHSSVFSLDPSQPFVSYAMNRRGRAFTRETVETERDTTYSKASRQFFQGVLDTLRLLNGEVVIPFPNEGRLTGFLVLKTQGKSSFSTEQQRLFVPLSRRVGLLLRHAQAFSQTRDREKLAALGEMSAGLAHEIRNPLGAIRGAAELLRDGGSRDSSESRECLNIILDETARLGAVLNEFLDYARPRRDNREQMCSPLRIIEHTSELILRDRKVKVEIDATTESCFVCVDPESLKQVLLNLFINAVEAMEGAKEVPRLQVRLKVIHPPKTSPFSLAAHSVQRIWESWGESGRQASDNEPLPQPRVEIQVIDNGRGIAKADIDRVFLPFYTTKSRGTGLGLAICQRLIVSMGGEIHVAPNHPSGTVFTIGLPLVHRVEEVESGSIERKGALS